MTKLEEEIKAAIFLNPKQTFMQRGLKDESFDMMTVAVIAAAEVAKKYIESAYNAGAANELCLRHKDSVLRPRAKWLKENGVI